MGTKVKLKEIVGNYAPDKGINKSYDWYRKDAQKYGCVYIGDIKIPVHKERGSWLGDLSDFDRAIRSFINKKTVRGKHRQLMMEDYQKKIFHLGKIWISDSRFYENKGDFRKEVDTYSLARKDSDGVWYCNTCNKIAETEYNNLECHICSDWNGCGKDCTLSKIYCSQCEKFLTI